MALEPDPKQGESSTHKSGNARIKYDPVWSKGLPYCTFDRGTARRQFGTAAEARRYLGDMHAPNWSVWA